MSLDIVTTLFVVQFCKLSHPILAFRASSPQCVPPHSAYGTHHPRTALLYYDYALTLGREIELFWKLPRWSWPFVLFIANRYLIVLGHVPLAVYFFWSPGVGSNYSVCNPLLLYNGWLAIVVQAVGGIVMIMRVYALYERSRCVLAMLVFFGVCGILVGAWAVSSLPFSPPAVPTLEFLIGCPGKGLLTFDQGLYLAAAWSGQLLFDMIVFGLTLWRSVSSRTPGKRSISDVLLRDGCLYFAVMSIANLGNIITLLVVNDNVKNIAPSFTNIISATMISRLMLNLRDPSVAGRAVASFPPLSHPSAFASTRGLPGVETTTMG
ncbi:hypothetical protein BKA82DRAFT_1003386 [Pisolithus tinctorius]|nr:hypothetical protein BKA82DRAFT_1003386 [Pisolithus tinctorius]